MRLRLVVPLVLGLVLASSLALAQGPVVTYVFDEYGNGFGDGPGGHANLPGVLKPDPGPGGLAAALTYGLAGPPSLVAGDLVLLEPGTDAISDIIRFNPAGIVPGYASQMVFYSDNTDGADTLADTGFPTALYSNAVRMFEVGPEGNNGLVYTPTANQPGYVAGFTVTYNIHSDGPPVPEPGSAAMLLGMLVPGGLFVWRRRRA